MKEVEDIIISKRFFELTPEEFEAVREFAANEDDYEAMRWFLQSTRTAFEEEKIEAGPNLRKNVMARLNRQVPGRTIWLNGASAFLFPKEKRLYQSPAFQIAAVGLLLVGLTFVYNESLTADQQLAQVVTPVEERADPENEKSATAVLPEQTVEEKEEVASTGGAGEGQASVPGEHRVLFSEPADEDAPAPVTTDLDQLSAVEDENRKDLSVAEESRVNSENNIVTSHWGYSNTYRSDGLTSDKANSKDTGKEGQMDDSERLSEKSDISKESGLEEKNKLTLKESPNRNESDSRTTNSPAAPGTTTSGADSKTVSGIAGNEDKKTEREGGKFVTATVGGVYGDTATLPAEEESEAVEPDENQPAAGVSISESKELKVLFFSIK